MLCLFTSGELYHIKNENARLLRKNYIFDDGNFHILTQIAKECIMMLVKRTHQCKFKNSLHGDYMSNFKKAFFGGYKKREVDATIIELNKKLEELDSDRKKFQRESRSAENRIVDLEAKLSELSTENEKLNSSRAQSETIFNDIAKIYKRAYGAGREIVCDSKETAQRLLNDIGVRFDEMMGETQGIIDEYENIHRDMDKMFETLNRDMSGVAQTASHMLERAKAFAGIYGQMKSSVESAQENTERLLDEYNIQASEFLSRDFFEPSENPNHRTEQVSVSAETVVSESDTTVAAPTVVNDVSEKNAENNNSEGFNNSEKLSVEEKVEEEPFHNETYVAQASEEVTPENRQEPHSEQKAENSVPDVKQAPKNNETVGKQVESEFTQFGRKSKISAQDRSELLRKALLKNGGN